MSSHWPREKRLSTSREGANSLRSKGRVLIHSRDEAHRFVNRFHSHRRRKGSIRDPLEEVEGLGAKKIQSLLRHFGGRKGIEHASIDELRAVPGIGISMAKKIQNHFEN